MSNQNVPRTLSLSEAAALLRMHKNTLQERARTGPVFLFRGKPISSVKTAFMAACIRAQVGRYEAGGYQGFTWHGLRHTWATWHVQNGTPLDVLQKLGGWSDLRINSPENCLRVIDIEFMRSTGHLNIRPKKVKK